jgi:MAE_28990/MAE_18760-like HEPN
MTYGFQEDFALRRRQVKRYLDVVRQAENQLKWTDKSNLASERERLNVLRAGTFLVLYNLIESAARTSLRELHDTMVAERVEFGVLRRSIRREVIKGFKKRAKPDIHQDMIDVTITLVSCALDAEDHFSGNVDAKRLRDIASVYGFSSNTDKRKTHGGSDLLTIKNIRNDLAHGHKTYDEVGRDYPFKLLLGIACFASGYVKALLDNIADYLDAGGFREPEANGVVA